MTSSLLAAFGLAVGALHGLHDAMWLRQCLDYRRMDERERARLLWRRHAAGLALRALTVTGVPLGAWLLAPLTWGGAGALALCAACLAVAHHVSHNLYWGKPLLYNVLDYDA